MLFVKQTLDICSGKKAKLELKHVTPQTAIFDIKNIITECIDSDEESFYTSKNDKRYVDTACASSIVPNWNVRCEYVTHHHSQPCMHGYMLLGLHSTMFPPHTRVSASNSQWIRRHLASCMSIDRRTCSLIQPSPYNEHGYIRILYKNLQRKTREPWIKTNACNIVRHLLSTREPQGMNMPRTDKIKFRVFHVRTT